MVRDLALSLLWHGFDLWPRNFCMLQVHAPRKKKKKTGEWINKLWHNIYSGKELSNKKELWIRAATWINFKTITLNERSQTKKSFTVTCYKILKNVSSSRVTESRIAVAWG